MKENGRKGGKPEGGKLGKMKEGMLETGRKGMYRKQEWKGM